MSQSDQCRVERCYGCPYKVKILRNGNARVEGLTKCCKFDKALEDSAKLQEVLRERD